MSQFFENFESQTLSAVPSGFTSRWVTPSAGTEVVAAGAGADALMGSQVFRIKGTGGGFTYERVGFEITSISGSTKDRMAALFEGLTSSIDKVPTLILRGAGASAGARSGYMLWLRGGSGNFQIRRVSSGSSSNVASGTLPSSVTTLGATAKVEFSALDDGAGNVDIAATVWEVGESKPVSPQLTHTDTSPLAVGWVGVGTASADSDLQSHEIGYVGVGTNDDLAPTEPVATTQTIRKASTFDIETTLGTITTATLNGVNVFDHVTGQVGTTVSFAGAATDEITTSGEYPLVLGDGVGTETITVQVNVYGPYILTDHGAAHSNSIMSDANFASSGTVQLKVIDDFDPAKAVFNWQAFSDNQLWRSDVNTLDAVTVNAATNTTDTATIGWMTPDGTEGQFTVTVEFTEPVIPNGMLVPRGNSRAIKIFAENNITKGSYNERAIKYFISNGATSRQYNHAQKQFEDS